MSEQSQGPGWWQASDGKWYAPEPAPPVDPTAPQAAAGPTAPPPAGGSPMPPAAAAAGGGGSTAKIIGIVVALALVAGGVAFALTRDGGGGGNSIQAFCDKAKALHNDIDLDEGFEDASTVDKVVNAFGEVNKVAPSEIKADMNLLHDGLKKAGQAVKDGKDLTDVFTEEEGQKLDTLGKNVEKFGTEKCGGDFLLSSSSSSSSTDSSTSSSSSSSRSSSSSSSTSAAGAVTDAVATRDKLIALAKEPGAVDASAEGAVAAWRDAFPGVGFTGSGNPATANKVSGFAAVFSKIKEVGFLAFAVVDTRGQCAGGVLEFDDAGTSVTNSVNVEASAIGSDCTGANVGELAGY